MKYSSTVYDFIVVGSGMGGLTTAALLAQDGHRVLVLEAAHVAGGCSSSFKRQGFVFESGATTLTGFDENQPLRHFEQLTGLKIPRTRLDLGMTVWMYGKPIHKFEDRNRWIVESIRFFGEEAAQKMFWKLALETSDLVWKVSQNNPFFPPSRLDEWISLAMNNSPLDAKILPFAGISTLEVVKRIGIQNPEFIRFLDEQLLITAQSSSEDTPFLFAAPALCYTNYANFYVPGGLLEMAKLIQEFIIQKGGVFLNHRKVVRIEQLPNAWFEVETAKGERFKASQVISNLPIWNMAEVTQGWIKDDFEHISKHYDRAWGAYTMNIATTDTYDPKLSLHHQIHVDLEEGLPHTGSRSIFVSLSDPNDRKRTPEGTRAMNVSCHADPEYWFNLNGEYETARQAVMDAILDQMRKYLPGFAQATLLEAFPATPVTWEKWIHRSKGRVGGLPQSMGRSILDWPKSQTHAQGLWLCGDTVYPGQGIPGVTLSGINVYLKIKRHISRQRRNIFV